MDVTDHRPQSLPNEASQPKKDAISEFVRATVYSAAEEPLRGVAQLFDGKANGALDGVVQSGFSHLISQDKESADEGTGAWYGQQLGGAVGMMLPFMFLHGKLKSVASRAIGEQTIYKSALEIKTGSGLLKYAGTEAGLSGATGLVYGSVFKPAESHDAANPSGFWSARALNGLSDATSFAALGLTNSATAHVLGTAAGALVESGLPSSLAKPLAKGLTLPLLSGAIAGVPGGALSAEIGAWRDGRSHASTEELRQSIHSMVFVGAAFGTGQWLSAQKVGTNVTNARHIADAIGVTKPIDANQATFEIVGSPNAIDRFQKQLNSGASQTDARVDVRQHVFGLFSGWARGPQKLGDVRSMILHHDANASTLGPRAIELAGTSGLIASCLPLETPISSRDVFKGRSQGTQRSVFFDRSGSTSFSLVHPVDFLSASRIESNGLLRLGAADTENDARAFLEDATRGGRNKDLVKRLEQLNVKMTNIVHGISSASPKRGLTIVGKMLDAGAQADDLARERLRGLVGLFDLIEPSGNRVAKAMGAQREQIKLDELSSFINQASDRPEKRRRVSLVEQALDASGSPNQLAPRRIKAIESLNAAFGIKTNVVQYLLQQERGLATEKTADIFIPSIAKFVDPEYRLSRFDESSFNSQLNHSGVRAEAQKRIFVVRRLVREQAPPESFDPEYLALYNRLEQVLGPDDPMKTEIISRLHRKEALKPVVYFLDVLKYGHRDHKIGLRSAKQSSEETVSIEQLLKEGITGEQLNSLAELAGAKQTHPSLLKGGETLLSFVYPPLVGRGGELSNRIAEMEAQGLSHRDAVLLHATLMQSTLRDNGPRDLKIKPDPSLLVSSVNATVFSDAVRHLVPEQVIGSSYSEQFRKLFFLDDERGNTPLLALKLSLVMDSEWQSFIQRYIASGEKLGNIEKALPLSPREAASGLVDLLSQNPHLPFHQVELLSEFWTGLTPRTRSQPLDALLNQLQSAKTLLNTFAFEHRFGFARVNYPLQERAALAIVNCGLDNLSLEKRNVLVKAFKNQSIVEDAVKRSQSDAGYRFDAAIVGWQIDPSLPLDIAERVGQMKPFWKRLVARRVWQEQADAGWQTDETYKDGRLTAKGQAKFESLFDAQVALGRDRAGMLAQDAVEASQALHPNLSDADRYLVAHAVHHLPLPEQLKVVSGLNAGAFSNALTELDPEGEKRWEIDERRNVAQGIEFNKLMEEMNGGANWQHSSALKLVSTFGKEWRTWLTKMDEMGVNRHDGTFWLPVDSSKDLKGLSTWLMRNRHRLGEASIKLSKRQVQGDGQVVISQEDISGQQALQSVGQRWSALNVAERALPFKQLVTLSRSNEYANYVDHEFAQQSARAGVAGGKEEGQFEYNQHRFLASLETPSLFPNYSAESSPWTAGDLVGFFLPRNDSRGLYLGVLSGCCQHPNDAARTAAWYGQESPSSGFFVVVDKNAPQKIVAQSWAWASTNGGLMFDSVESRGLSGRGADVAAIYEKAARDLVQRDFHTVAVAAAGNGWDELRNNNWTHADSDSAMTLTENPKQNYIYSDAALSKQRVIATNPTLPRVARSLPESWVSGAALNDMAAADKVVAKLYGNIEDAPLSGDFGFLLRHKTDGVIGYATINSNDLHVTDVAVLPEHQPKFGGQFVSRVLRQVVRNGHEWTADLSNSGLSVLRELNANGYMELVGEDTEVLRNQGGQPITRVTFKAKPSIKQESQTAEPAQ